MNANRRATCRVGRAERVPPVKDEAGRIDLGGTRSARPTLQKRRAGFAFYEAVMASALTLAAIAGVAHLLGVVTQQRRAAQEQSAALVEAGNLMEDLASRPWDELTPQRLAAVELSDQCRRRLPHGKLRLEVAAEDQDAKRIGIQIEWGATPGRTNAPVRLTAWRYRDQEARP